MLDWLRQQLLFDPRIPTPLGWGVCQKQIHHLWKQLKRSKKAILLD
jgi:hypothetical protein